MRDLFNRSRPNLDSVRQIKQLFSEQFKLTETTTLSVAELNCHEPECPPVETIVTARHADGTVLDWRIPKPINNVLPQDIKLLKTK